MGTLRWIEDNPYDPKLGFWSRANVGEVLPDPPSPLGWDLVFDNGGTVMGWRDCMVKRLGMGDDEVHPTRPEVCGVFGGYAFLGITMLRVWAERTPGFTADALDAAYFAGHPGIPPYVAEPWHENPATTAVMTEWLGWVMGDRNQNELEADRIAARELRASRPDLSTLSDAELLQRAVSLRPMFRDLFSQHINQSGAASIGPGVLGAVCAAIGDPTATMRLLGGVGGVDSAAPSAAMWELSRTVRASDALTALFNTGVDGLTDRLRSDTSADAVAFVKSLDEFVAEFGSRGPNEWDIHSHTWETKPDLVLAAVDRMRFAEDTSAPHLHQADRGSRTASTRGGDLRKARR